MRELSKSLDPKLSITVTLNLDRTTKIKVQEIAAISTTIATKEAALVEIHQEETLTGEAVQEELGPKDLEAIRDQLAVLLALEMVKSSF